MATAAENRAQLTEIKRDNKDLSTYTGLALSVYFGVIGIADLKQALPLYTSWPLYCPLIFWAVSLIVSAPIMTPFRKKPRWVSEDSVAERRLKTLRALGIVSSLAFSVGLIWMAVAMIYYLFFVQLPTS